MGRASRGSRNAGGKTLEVHIAPVNSLPYLYTGEDWTGRGGDKNIDLENVLNAPTLLAAPYTHINPESEARNYPNNFLEKKY